MNMFKFQLDATNYIYSVVNQLSKTFIINVKGNGNKIYIFTQKQFKCAIMIGDNDNPVNDCTIVIGEGTTSNGCEVFIFEDNSKFIIGNNVMISDNVKFWVSDSHALIDSDTKECLNNKPHSIIIHDNVWVCQNSSFLKDTEISTGSIVGLGSVVTKKFIENNIVIAGNPAKIVKHNVTWDRARPKYYKQ